MRSIRHTVSRLSLVAASMTLALGCSDAPVSEQDLDSQEDGVVGRMFDKLTSFFSTKAAQDTPIAPHEPYVRPDAVSDPTVDELFETMGLEEVDPDDEDARLDGALVGLFEHFPDDNDPNDAYDSVCFFAKSPDQSPSEESLFWAEMYGFRSTNGEVSDIHGKPIEMECVGCEEGNTGGGETRVIFYVNGIDTDHETHCDTLESIADLTGAVTIGVLNETEGTAKDIWQTAWDRFTVQIENKLADWGIDKTVEIHENDAAAMLTNVIVQRIRQGKHVEIWAHSQGGAVTSLALHRALRALAAEGRYPVMKAGKQQKDAIRVTTFGSAASQWPEGTWPKGPMYTHYVHLRDATPAALGVGAFGGYATVGKQRAGGDATTLFFDGAPPDRDRDERPSFSEIAANIAEIGFLDLDAYKFHGVDSCYFEMYLQKHGSWLEGTNR